MMQFMATQVELTRIYDMPDSWSDAEYRSLLQQLEIEDIDDLSGSDLLDILIMGLQDMEPEETADLVLAHKLQSSVTPGSRRNIIEDFLEGQRPWEQLSDIGLHSRVFAAAVLLNKVFPKSFARPDMMKLTLCLQALKPEAKKLLQSAPEAAFVTRLLADGMDERSILERLFDEQLAATVFPEAEGIVWLAHYSDAPETNGDAVMLTVYSSEHWLEDMESVSKFESSAYNDHPPEEDDI